MQSVNVTGVVVECWAEAVPVVVDHPKAGAQVLALQPYAASIAGLFRRLRPGDVVSASGMIWLVPATQSRRAMLSLTCYRLVITGGRITVPETHRRAVRALEKRGTNGA